MKDDKGIEQKFDDFKQQKINEEKGKYTTIFTESILKYFEKAGKITISNDPTLLKKHASR